MKVSSILQRSASLLIYAFFLSVTAAVGHYFWLTLDENMPVRIDYEAPYFSSRPVSNREDALRYQISKAQAQAPLYRYVEWCVLRPIQGTLQKSWRDGLLYNEPPVKTAAQVGCYAQSIREMAPDVKGHTVHFDFKTEYPVNRFKTLTLHTDTTLPIYIEE